MSSPHVYNSCSNPGGDMVPSEQSGWHENMSTLSSEVQLNIAALFWAKG